MIINLIKQIKDFASTDLPVRSKSYRKIGQIMLLFVFIGFVAFYSWQDRLKEKQIMLDHSRVVEKALYWLDDEVPVNYLEIACQFYNYNKISIYDNFGNIFLEVDGPPLTTIDKAFTFLRLINERKINTNITHNGQVIGNLVVIRHMKQVYVYLQAIFVLAMLYIAYIFLAWIILIKKELEKRVKERTLKLEEEINERKQTELELIKAKEKAEESDRLKSAFLANMSHEIRTPMNGILGFADLLQEPALSGKSQQKYISVIKKSGDRMLNIINDIIDISKLEAGLVQPDLAETNLNRQIEYIYTFFKHEAEAKHINLIYNKTLSSKQALVITDKEKLYAILTNLVKNAIKYTNTGTIEIGCLRKERFYEFYVKDTGIGIPKERQKAIFERFIQADIDDKCAHQGAGLGLSITKSYIEMLGGEVWVESEKDVGSCFYFTLPFDVCCTDNIHSRVSAESNNMVDEIKDTILETNHLNILIVEDDSTSEMLLSTIIEPLANKIFKAYSGEEAIEAINNNPDIDLVLMDIKLPDMNGLSATKKIRQINQEVIIIAQTAFGMVGDEKKVLEAGCNGYILKPIEKDKLLEVIRKYLTKNQN